MTTLTIRIPDAETQKVSSFIEDLGGEVVASYLTKEELRQQTLKELEEGLHEAFDIIEGKAKRTSLMQEFVANFVTPTPLFVKKPKG